MIDLIVAIRENSGGCTVCIGRVVEEGAITAVEERISQALEAALASALDEMNAITTREGRATITLQ